MEPFINLIYKYNFTFHNNLNNPHIQLGNGDILFYSLHIDNNIINNLLYVNIHFIVENNYNIQNPLNFFEFKLLLFKKLNKNVLFYYNKNINYLYQSNNKYITNFSILQKYFDLTYIPTNKYIIFHTKCRFVSEFNYNKLKTQIKSFCSNYKTNYNILLLGEKYINPSLYEVNYHKITTIYNELLELKNNNNIIDLTIDNIYDNSNFQNYLKDISIIHNADLNICFGIGGQFCNSMFFGKKTYAYLSPLLNIQSFNLNEKQLNNNNIFIFDNIDIFFNNLSTNI